jgi:hypothetical protein
MEPDHYDALFRSQVYGRHLILTGAPLAAFDSSFLQRLLDHGAAGIFIIADGVGTGDLPSADLAEWIVLPARAESINDEIRRFRRKLARPSKRLRDRLDEWDPERKALVVGVAFYSMSRLAGRKVLGARRPEWEALEDKVVIDEVWDAAGVEREPTKVVTAQAAALKRAARNLDRGDGTVWAGDAREGFNGGAEYARWIRTKDDQPEAIAFFGEHCDRVRVMPFLEGIPCSIHGMVFPETTIVFRPCELITLRTGGSIFFYAGFSSYWDPPDRDRQEMRDIARRVGEALRARVDYRGTFTVDGVMTVDGFRPTELNARAGAALSLLIGPSPHIPLGIIQRALIEGQDYDYRPAELEMELVTAADDNRRAGIHAIVSRRQEKSEQLGVTGQVGELRLVDKDEQTTASLTFGPGAVGGFLRADATGLLQAGYSAAPVACQLLALGDSHWQLGIGELLAPKSVRL